MASEIFKNFGVVMPVGNLQNDRVNIERIISDNEVFLIETILVIDNQELAHIIKLQKYIEENGLKHTKLFSGIWNNPGGARNFGLSLCTRTWISFWDSDDTQYLPNLEKALNLLEHSDFDAGICRFETRTGEFSALEKIPKFKNPETALSIRLLSNSGIWRMIFRRSAMSQIRFAEFSSAEDQIFLLRILRMTPRICEINQVTYSYVQGGRKQLINSLTLISNSLEAIDVGLNEIESFSNKWKTFSHSLLLKLILSVILRGVFVEKVQAIRKLKIFYSKIGIVDFFHAFGAVIRLFLAHRNY